MLLQGKVALITGASSGIGEAMAREFARRGAHVAILARRADRIEKITHDLESPFCQTLPVVCDVTREGDLKRAVDEVVKRWGRIDFVVANAGFGVVGNFDRLEVADFERQFETNVFGVLRTLKAVYEELKKTHGSVGIVGSVNGYLSFPGNSPYCMSKYAVRALSESLRGEWGRMGISVTHIAPGFVASEIRTVNNLGILQSQSKDPIPSWLVMPAAKAARQIVNALVKRRAELVITGHGKFGVFLARHFPRLVRWVISLLSVSARSEPT